MVRVKIPKEVRRRTIAFSLQEKDIKRLDDFIVKEQIRPYTVVNRQTIIEGLVLDFLSQSEKKKAV